MGTVLGILGTTLCRICRLFADFMFRPFYINVYADIRYYGPSKTTTTKQLKLFGARIYALCHWHSHRNASGSCRGNWYSSRNYESSDLCSFHHKCTVESMDFPLVRAFLPDHSADKLPEAGTIASKVSPIEAVRFTEGQNLAFQRKKRERRERPERSHPANLGRNKNKLLFSGISFSESYFSQYGVLLCILIYEFAQKQNLE